MFKGLVPDFFRDKFQDVESIPDLELEDSLISCRRVAITTDPYEEERKYEAAYYRCKEILARILERHECYLYDFLATGRSITDITLLPKMKWTQGNLSYYPSETYLAAALVYFNGWMVRGNGYIDEDKSISFTLVDYLLKERGFEKALLVKGLAHKYGIGVYSNPDIELARECFEKAASSGASTALIELEFLAKHEQLTELEFNHIFEDTWGNHSWYSSMNDEGS